jgi:hypothetical protein
MKHIDSQDDYRNYKHHKENSLACSFYEEMEVVERELKDLLCALDAGAGQKEMSTIRRRNVGLINMNFNYILAMLNNYKLDPFNPCHQILAKINMINLFIFVVQEFKQMRRHDPDFFYFGYDEENRYIDNVRRFFNSKPEAFLPGRLSFLFLRHVRYYVFKIKKYFLRDRKEKHTWKCGFYVIIGITF